MRSLIVSDFDLAHTVQSAQPLAFFGDPSGDGNGVTYACGGSLVEARQAGSRLEYTAYGAIGGRRLDREIAARFRLEDDMRSVYAAIETDAFMRRATKRYRGLRITKNGPWETALCFVISQFNNVKRIRGIVKRLITAYGEEHALDSGGVRLSFRSFPEPEALAKAGVRDLMAHGAGFRARYIKALAEECSGSVDLGGLGGKGYEGAKEALMELDGIGDKVADCILLFGYGRLNAFPIDTWVQRAMERTYFGGRRQSIGRLHEFAEKRWGPYAGYAQQYMFWAFRNSGKGRAGV
jgi:N-glycosylase/DNA lyase